MSRRLRTLLFALGLASLLASPSASAQSTPRVTLTVVDVAAGRAYLTPGESSGVTRGSELVVGRQHFRVVGTTASYVVVELGTQTLALGAQARLAGVGEVVEESAPTVHVGNAEPLTAYTGQWPDAVHPAETQQPDPVALGRAGGDDRFDVSFSTTASVVAPIDGDRDPIFRGDLRARVYAQPFDGLALWVRGDVAGQLWLANDLDQRQGGDARPWLRVRELAVGYGSETGSDFYGALGRLRYAATGLGQLDGLRIRTPSLAGVTVGAFGGFVPDPRSGLPDFETQRFGVELAYRDLTSEWRPQVSLVAHGSLFHGTFDERRLNAQLQLFPGPVRIGGAVELSLHDPDNAWHVGELEVSSANVDTSIRVDDFDIGVRLDMRRPERSLWLASLLPRTWLCTVTPMAGNVDEPCSGTDDSRYAASLDTGVRVGDVSLRGGATYVQYAADATLTQLGGYATVRATRMFVDALRGDLFFSGNTGALIDGLAGRAGLGVVIVPDVLDLGAHYRLSWNHYRADIDGFLQHAAGGTITVTPIPELAVYLLGEAVTSRDYGVVLVSLNITARPWR